MIVYSFESAKKCNAAPKAPADINAILSRRYNARIITRRASVWSKACMAFSFIFARLSREVVVVQHPFLCKSFIFGLLNRKKLIIFVHDINGLRRQDNAELRKEINIFKKSDYIIAHNDAMKKYLIQQGVPAQTIYTNDIFDYLCRDKVSKRERIGNEVRVAYAGNLARKKSPFLYELDEKRMAFQLRLYGVGADKNINSKETYIGGFLPDELPSKIEADLGLVWDGEPDESDKDKLYKNYTRYNNPHKVSCYLAAGIPVIVWRQAAIAKFVEENNVGYLISNIYDINKLDYTDYATKAHNATKIGERLQSGCYTERVIDEVLRSINGD